MAEREIEPGATEVILGRIQASEENTSTRIAQSDAHSAAILNAHEVLDQQRADDVARALHEHRYELGGKIDILTGEVANAKEAVNEINGGLRDVKSKVELIEDREDQRVKRRATTRSWQQLAATALLGAVCAGLVALGVFLITGSIS